MQLTQTPQWQLLSRHADEMKAVHVRELFERAPARFDSFHAKDGALLLDYSRQRITEKTISLLLECLNAQGFDEKRAALFEGAPVNTTEKRAALHMALRGDKSDMFLTQGVNVMPDVLAERQRAYQFAEAVRCGALKGQTGKDITDVVHVGIGGSDLGPRLLASVLADGKGPTLHFIGNIDADPLDAVMAACDPERTLVIIASKTFTTLETMQNAATLVAWLQAALGAEKAKQHLVALTVAADAAKNFGVQDAHIFHFWEWVGGRTSICSAIGLPAMLAMGAARFDEFLKGARIMDAHFRTAPLHKNLPVLLAALDVWNVNFMGATARAVLPYAEKLFMLPFYLQQLEMESLGKQTDAQGKAFSHATNPVVFGATGTPAQHAFMQALHQGNMVIPAEIICVKKTGTANVLHHKMLLANALAQAEALANGTSPEESPPSYKYFSGNRPSTLIVVDSLGPSALGQLIALYEHKVFTQSVFWNINAFDQWGVELGKVLAGPILSALRADAHVGTPSLRGIIKHLKEN